jgi:membrane protein
VEDIDMPDVKVSPANELRRTPPPAPRRAAQSPPQSTSSALFGGLGFMEIVRRIYNEVLADDCLGRAAQLAYYFLFALFPFLLFLTTLLGYLPVPNLIDNIMLLLARALPREALVLIQDNVHTLVTQPKGGLLSFGIIAALWTSSSAITAITAGLNHAYGVEESRPWWKVRMVALLLILGSSLFVIAATVLLIFGPQLGTWLASSIGLGHVFAVVWNIARWIIIPLCLIMALAALYYFAPDVEQQWRWITPGSVCAVIGWILASLGFAYYVNNFGSYNTAYGSIGAVIMLLTWMYVTGFFILVGGELNSELEHAAAKGKNPGERTLPNHPDKPEPPLQAV